MLVNLIRIMRESGRIDESADHYEDTQRLLTVHGHTLKPAVVQRIEDLKDNLSDNGIPFD